ncbi:hypothetical protein [Citrobacter sedlakii]|uniref:hypothetical protein n=1 Tax=Citrobacter sedlakii TaxID=67826 RepID=UPI00397CD094
MKITALLLGAVSLLVGCSTVPISNHQAEDVPSAQILNKDFLQKKDNLSTVVIKRDAGMKGSICTTRIYIDGKPAADLRTAQKVTVYLPAGEHIFSSQTVGACAGGVMSEYAGLVAEGKTLTFRIGSGPLGDFEIYPTAF